MPALDWYRGIDAAVAFDGDIVVNERVGIHLRRQGADGKHDPSRSLAVAGSYVTFPNLAGTGISSLWGLEVVQPDTVTNAGTVEFQLSQDNGATWKYWSGAAWVVIGADTWNTLKVVQTNITTFPLGVGAVRGVRLRMRLKPGIKDTTPLVTAVWFLVEFDHDPVVDVWRTLKRHIDAARVGLWSQEAADGTGNVALSAGVFGFTLDQALPIRAYNITDEPGEGTDLFSSYNAVTEQVVLTGPQTVGDRIKLYFSVSAPTRLVPRAIYYDSTVPTFEVGISGDDDEEQSGGCVLEINNGAAVARRRTGPRYLRMSVTLTGVDEDNERSSAMIGALRDLFVENQIFSLATGLAWPVTSVNGMRERATLNDRIFSPGISFDMWVREDTKKFTASAMVSAINFRINGAGKDVWYDETFNWTP